MPDVSEKGGLTAGNGPTMEHQEPPPMDAEGPRDFADMVIHHGEARSLADTAYHSLEPDAPTLPAAAARSAWDEEEDPLESDMPLGAPD